MDFAKLLCVLLLPIIDAEIINGKWKLDSNAEVIALKTNFILLNVSLVACASQCQKSSGCSSFSIKKVSKICTGYSLEASDMETVILANMKFYYDYGIKALCDLGYTYRPTHNLCYSINLSKKNWQLAMEKCTGEGGGVFVIDTIPTKIYFLSIATVFVGDTVWLGGYEMLSNGTWFWWTGEPMSMSKAFWRYNEPNEYYPNEDCAAIWIGVAGFVDNNCGEYKEFICQKTIRV